MQAPLVTAIVSTYNSERFMRGCLEDLLAQTITSELEIIVIDSGSQQNEGVICQEFTKQYNNIHYYKTEREGLYEAWNRAIGLARGKYLTSANTDDRHRYDSFQRLAKELDHFSEIVLAYGDQLTSEIENETFDACEMRAAKRLRFPSFTASELMLRCITGSQPMWRSSVHKEYGLFNPIFRIAGDYEFWLRLSQTRRFYHVSEPLGVFYDSPNTLSGANNKWPCDLESLKIRLKYLNLEPWRSDQKLRPQLAKELFGIGYRYVQKKQLDRAKVFLSEAWKLDPINFNFAKTYLLRGLIGSNWRL